MKKKKYKCPNTCGLDCKFISIIHDYFKLLIQVEFRLPRGWHSCHGVVSPGGKPSLSGGIVRRQSTMATLRWRRVEIISSPSGPRSSNSWSEREEGGEVKIRSCKPKIQSSTLSTYHCTHIQTHIQTCIHILWLTNTPKHTATAKAEHLVITIHLVKNMLCRLASQI